MTTVDESVSSRARTLAFTLEPIAGQVYFAPECHRAYESLGFGASPGEFAGAVLPDLAAYFTSRGSVLGQVPGEVVAAAFGVFNPAVVVPSITLGWSLTHAPAIESARTEGAVAQLTRVLGPSPAGLDRALDMLCRAGDELEPAGRPLYGGLLACAVPDSPVGAMWRHADRLREYRGDSHVNAWTGAAFDAVEIGLLSDLWLGRRHRSFVKSRAWSPVELDAGEERLAARDLLVDGALTPAGREQREDVERQTDAQCRSDRRRRSATRSTS